MIVVADTHQQCKIPVFQLCAGVQRVYETFTANTKSNYKIIFAFCSYTYEKQEREVVFAKERDIFVHGDVCRRVSSSCSSSFRE